MIKRHLGRFKYAFSGLYFALRNDFSYASQVYGGALVIGIFTYFVSPNQTELMFLTLAWVLILITEIQNSALEEALDHMHPDLHHKIGRSKDMAAGAVLTAGFFLIFVMVVITFF